MTNRVWWAAGLCLASLVLQARVLPQENPVQIRYSGVLGQSQPEGTEPLPFIGASGVLRDKAGNLWAACGDQVFRFSKQERETWVSTRKAKLPGPMGANLGMVWDGEEAFLILQDRKVCAFNPETEAALPLFDLKEFKSTNRICFTVAPAGLSQGYASRGKVFILDMDAGTVSAYGRDGRPSGTVLTLAKPKDAKWWYCALGMEPGSGDLLVGSYYPDAKVYRFDASGRQVTAGGWPRKVNVRAILTVNGVAWALSDGAVALPPALTNFANAFTIASSWTYYTSGLAQGPDGNYWIASSQGLTQFDADGKPTQRRLGGIAGIRSMAVAGDGTLIVSIEGGQKMLRLSIADAPDQSLACNGNEPFRVGAGWTNKACDLGFDGKSFLIADETGKQLWRFDPWHTAWGEKPWIKATEPNTFTAPRALAMGDTLVWVLDGGRLLEGKQDDYNSFRPVKISAAEDLSRVVAMAASWDTTLILAEPTRLRAFSRSSDGTFTLLWETSEKLAEAVSLCYTENYVIASDRGANAIKLFSAQTGKMLGEVQAKDVKGGMTPGPVAASGRWLLAADEQGKRVLRFKIQTKMSALPVRSAAPE